jgi:hypothetical protein
MSWIVARIKIVPVKDGKSVSPDDAQGFIDQVREDALFGTYAELDQEYWKSRMDWGPGTLSEVELVGDPQAEPPRDCRRLQLLRRWSHDKQDDDEQILT